MALQNPAEDDDNKWRALWVVFCLSSQSHCHDGRSLPIFHSLLQLSTWSGTVNFWPNTWSPRPGPGPMPGQSGDHSLHALPCSSSISLVLPTGRTADKGDHLHTSLMDDLQQQVSSSVRKLSDKSFSLSCLVRLRRNLAYHQSLCRYRQSLEREIITSSF